MSVKRTKSTASSRGTEPCFVVYKFNALIRQAIA